MGVKAEALNIFKTVVDYEKGYRVIVIGRNVELRLQSYQLDPFNGGAGLNCCVVDSCF